MWYQIKDQVLEFVTEVKVRLLEEYRVPIMQGRKDKAAEVIRLMKGRKMPFDSFWPDIADYCEFASVKAILEQPLLIEVQLEDLADTLDFLNDETLGWRYKLRSQLLSMVKAAEEGRKSASGHQESSGGSCRPMTDEEAIYKVGRAVTVFACRRCNASRGIDRRDSKQSSSNPKVILPLLYPEPFSHPCMTRTQREDDRGSSDPSKLLKNDTGYRCCWNTEHLYLDTLLSSYAKTLVECANLDPETASIEAMDRLGVIFRCTACEDSSVNIELFGWRTAVRPPLNLLCPTKLNVCALSD